MRPRTWTQRPLLWASCIVAAAAMGFVVLQMAKAPLAPHEAEALTLPQRPVHTEVMHFWVAGSERGALNVIRDAYTQRGGVWVDTAEPDNGALRRALIDRISTNTMPVAVLWQSNVELRDLAELGVFGNLDTVAEREHWNAVLPAAVRARVQIDGHYYMAPTNVHALNWVFYNANVLRRLGVAEPRTWPEMIAAMHKARDAGVRPVALGDGDWEVQILFTTVLAGSLGADDYRELITHRNAAMLEKPGALQAFEVLADVRALTPRRLRYHSWDDAAHALARGDAAFNFMGDWAKAEMVRAGASIGDNVGCMLTPGVQDALMLTVDGFAFPASADEQQAVARDALASVMLDRQVQMRFAAAKGALPARIDARPRQPDRCESILMERLADEAPTLQAPNAGLPSALAGDFQMLVSRFYQDASMTPEQGRQALVAIFRNSQAHASGS